MKRLFIPKGKLTLLSKERIREGIIAAGNLYFRNRPRADIPENPQRILVFTRKAIGDIIMAIPAFKALRRRYPHSHLALCTLEWNREVVQALTFFDDVIIMENAALLHQSVSGLLRFILRIKRNRYDMAVLLDSFMFPFYCYVAGIPVRVGFEEGREGFALTHKVKTTEREYRRDNFLKVAELAGADIQDAALTFPLGTEVRDEAYVEKVLSQFTARGISKIIGIVAAGGRNPGQTVAAKNWTEEGFARVILELAVRKNAGILLFGRGEDDAQIADRILILMNKESAAEDRDRIVNLINRTTLMQAALFFSKCRVVLTNDTSLMHLAGAAGTPTVSIFGPTNPANLAPRDGRHQVVQSPAPCSPCYESRGFLGCQGECMKEIPWETVYDAVVKLLDAADNE